MVKIFYKRFDTNYIVCDTVVTYTVIPMSLSELKAMLFAPDKILHGKASVGVLIGTIVIAIVGYLLGLHPVSIMILEGGFMAALSVEGTQWYDNKKAKERGDPPPHEVSVLDAFFSTLAPLVAVIVLEVVRALGQLPPWLAVFSTDRVPFWMSI